MSNFELRNGLFVIIISKVTIRFPAKVVTCGSMSGLFVLEGVTNTGEKRPPSESSSSEREENRRLKHMLIITMNSWTQLVS